MSDFKFACPKCGQNISCDTSNAGMQIACPACQTMLTVPQPPAAVPSGPMSGGPGKLSINKAAAGHHAPPPSQAKSGAPVPGSISAQRQAAPAAPLKNKKGLIWGSVLGGVLLVAAIAWFGFIAPARERERLAKEEQQQKDEAARLAEEKKKRAEDAKPKEMPVSWTMDLSRSTVPERTVSGTVNGQPFTADTVTFVSGVLTLRQTGGLISQFVISPVRPAETNSYEVTQDSIGNIPHVVLNWKDTPKPGLETFNKGYVMKLAFNPASVGGKVSGKIYLCLPDDAQTYVAGNFEVGAKPAASVGANGVRPPGAPKPPRKR